MSLNVFLPYRDPHIPDDEESVSLKESERIASTLDLRLGWWTIPEIVDKFLVNKEGKFYYYKFPKYPLVLNKDKSLSLRIPPLSFTIPKKPY